MMLFNLKVMVNCEPVLIIRFYFLFIYLSLPSLFCSSQFQIHLWMKISIFLSPF